MLEQTHCQSRITITTVFNISLLLSAFNSKFNSLTFLLFHKISGVLNGKYRFDGDTDVRRMPFYELQFISLGL